jgi:hypothetical protein
LQRYNDSATLLLELTADASKPGFKAALLTGFTGIQVNIFYCRSGTGKIQTACSGVCRRQAALKSLG